MPADHLGAELKFLALLCYAEMQAWQGGRASEAIHLNGLQEKFLRDHLGNWAPDRWRRIEQAAGQSFYRLAAGLALNVLAGQKERAFA